MAKSRVDFKYNWKVYWSFLKNYKWLVVASAICIILLQAASLTEKLLFKQVVDKGTEFSAHTLSVPVFAQTLLIIAFVFVGLLVGRSIVRFLGLRLQNSLETHLILDLKQRYYNHLIRLSHSFHVTHKTGSMIARIGRGSSAIERLTDFLVTDVFAILFQIIVVGGSLVYFDIKSATVVAITVIVFVVYTLYMQGIQRKEQFKMNKLEDIEKANLADSFTNIESVKYFGKEAYKIGIFATISNRTNRALRKYYNLYSWSDTGQNLILGIGTFFLVFFPIRSFLHGEITLGTVVLVYTIYGSIFNQVYGFMYGLRNYYRAMTDFHELFEYGRIEQEVKDKPHALNDPITQGNVEYKNIAFKYQDKRKIFDNFSLSIKPGEKVALVGHSGSGKTTLVKLLYRFYDVNKGEILIDGRNIKDFNQEFLRSELSIVPQEGVLFDDTIFNNIHFSNPKASRAEVLKAIKFAQLDRIIKQFPKKEDTIVGERGIKLSGGEKQRVSIARALLANKRIILLDEATSSLDSQTEHDIQADLKRLLEGRTAIIIAHRLSTIMHADKIVVLDKGKIVQIGKHNDLINQKGQYQTLWSLQKGGYIQD